MEIVFNSYIECKAWQASVIHAAINGDVKCIDLLVRMGISPKIIKSNYRVELEYICHSLLKFRSIDGCDPTKIEIYIELQESDEDDEEDLYEEDNQELIVFIKAYGGI